MKHYFTNGLRDETSHIMYKCVITAFVTSSIMLSFFLFHISKVVDIELILAFIYSFGYSILLPQIIGFVIYHYKIRKLRILSNLPIYLSPFLMILQGMIFGNITDELGTTSIFTVIIILAYFLLLFAFYGLVINIRFKKVL